MHSAKRCTFPLSSPLAGKFDENTIPKVPKRRKKRYSKYLNEKWPEIRKNGRTNFTLTKSFVYAFFGSIFINLYNVIFVGEKLTAFGLIIGLIVGLMIGLLFSDGEWARNEARFLTEPNNPKIDRA